MRPIQLVIFDCDGVLVDSERLIVKVEAQICRERGWELTEDDIIRERSVETRGGPHTFEALRRWNLSGPPR